MAGRISTNVATHGSAEVAMRDLERVDGHHPGVALTEKREWFIRLVSQGMSNTTSIRREVAAADVAVPKG